MTSTTHYPASTKTEQIETRTLCVWSTTSRRARARRRAVLGRGYNIDSLTVQRRARKASFAITIVTRGTPMCWSRSKTSSTAWCRCTASVDLTTTGPALQRELAMVKVRGQGEHRMERCGLPTPSAPASSTPHGKLRVEITGAPTRSRASST